MAMKLELWTERAACRRYPLSWWYPGDERVKATKQSVPEAGSSELGSPDQNETETQNVLSLPPPPRSQREQSEDAVVALRICRELCPVLVECLEHARLHDEKGIWGGTTEEERKGRRPRRLLLFTA